MITLSSAVYSIPLLSAIARKIVGRRFFALALLIASGSVASAVLGWAVREVGRKPWTVYGLLWSEEVASAVKLAITPQFALAFGLIIFVIAVFGLTAMYIVARR